MHAESAWSPEVFTNILGKGVIDESVCTVAAQLDTACLASAVVALKRNKTARQVYTHACSTFGVPLRTLHDSREEQLSNLFDGMTVLQMLGRPLKEGESKEMNASRCWWLLRKSTMPPRFRNVLEKEIPQSQLDQLKAKMADGVSQNP